MDESVEQCCLRLFRETVGNVHSVPVYTWDDKRLLAASLEDVDVDSLTLLDFVMQIENNYDIELDEAAVNACSSIGEVAELVAASLK
jgi:acyl carrier protein